MKKRKKKTKNNIIRYTISFATLFIAGTFFYQGVVEAKELATYQETLREKEEVLAEEVKRSEALEGYKKYLASDEYVIDTAREKLGAGYEGTIVFVPVD